MQPKGSQIVRHNWVTKLETRDQTANIHTRSQEKQENTREMSTSALSTMLKPLTVWKILQEDGITDHLTCLLRNLYAGQEARFRTGHGKTNWLKIGKGLCQGCIVSPCLFNLYSEYIMRNAELDESQAGMKTAGRNINNLRHAVDTTLLEESEELKSLGEDEKRH